MIEATFILCAVGVLFLVAALLVSVYSLLRQLVISRMEDWLLDGNQLPSVVGYLLVRWRRWRCGVRGHRENLELDFDRMWLSCNRCGYESRGVRLHPKKVA